MFSTNRAKASYFIFIQCFFFIIIYFFFFNNIIYFEVRLQWKWVFLFPLDMPSFERGGFNRFENGR